MPKFDQLVSGFNSGELSPLLYGSPDNPRYKKGLEVGLNYIPTLQGPIIRRPATMYANNVKDSTKPPVLIPFQFSITQAYMLEFGDKYIRFYANNAQVVTSGSTYKIIGLYPWGYNVYGSRTTQYSVSSETIITSTLVTTGSILEVPTPYAYTDVTSLRFVQNADTLYLFHPNYPVYKLQRFSQQLWDLTQVYFPDGPYLPLNSYALVGDNTNVTLTPLSQNLPSANVQTGPALTVTGMVNAGGLIKVTTSAAHGYNNGQKVFILGTVGTTEANNYDLNTGLYNSHPVSWTITIVTATSFTLNASTFTNAWSSGGTVYPALFAAQTQADINQTVGPDQGRSIALTISGGRYAGTIGQGTAITSPNASTVYCYMSDATRTQNAFPGTSVATAWQLGVWSFGNGFPASGTFHQQRLCVTGVGSFPQEVDGSMTGLFETFSPNAQSNLAVTDNSAIQFTLASNDANVLRWLKSTNEGLISGSYVAEWVISGNSSTTEAISPTNISVQQSSFFGSSNSEPVQLGNAIIYIQRSGRKVREMNYFFQVGTFRSSDLTELSEHITLPTVTKLALQKETQPLVWGMRSDGNLVSLIYNRDDVSLSAGWMRHQLGGQSDSGGTNPFVVSIASIPSTDLTFDQLWMIVKRYINGSTVYTVEYMTKIFDDSILQEDAFQGDCGATFYNPKTITAITTANPAVVTSASHGLSNGDKIKIVNVVGLNKSTTDVNGNTTESNLVNEQTFVVAGVTTNTFQLNDFNSNTIDSTSFSGYVSSGQVAKLVTTITGLTWLEGETVGILADGAIHPDVVVSNSGVITLNFPAAKVQIGYRFNSQGKLLRAEGGAADGTSFGKTRRTTRAAFQMHRIGDLSFGTSFTNLLPMEFSQADVNQADNAVPLFSGIKREGLESAYDFESQVCFQQSSMLPGTIQSITAFMEEQDI